MRKTLRLATALSALLMVAAPVAAQALFVWKVERERLVRMGYGVSLYNAFAKSSATVSNCVRSDFGASQLPV